MIKRIAALVVIFLCTTAAWIFLGSTVLFRTYHFDPELKQKVSGTWGAPQEQAAPTAYSLSTVVDKQTGNERRIETPLALESSRIDVSLDLEHRQKGLLWYSTYGVGFAGEYLFRNSIQEPRDVRLAFTLPAEHAEYDDLRFWIDGRTIPINGWNGKVLTTGLHVPAGGPFRVKIAYKSRGMDAWRYRFGVDVAQVGNFRLNLRTNFPDIDFPDGTLSPSKKTREGAGWLLTWDYLSLLSGNQIGIAMPEHVQPGPLAGEICYFAPVSLFFYFFVIFLLTTIRGTDIHPMNYFFIAAAFFAFHLLLAYLCDHISIHAAFLISSAVSVGLVVSYLRLVVGTRFAVREAAIAQILYLVLFSYAFFFKGFTGLAITIGAVLTLFAAMQFTGRINWSRQLSPPPLPL